MSMERRNASSALAGWCAFRYSTTMWAGPAYERGESSSSLSTTDSSSRHTGTRSAVRTPPATTTTPSTHANRRASNAASCPSSAPAANASPTDGRYNVRSATNTPAGYNRLATGNSATPIHPSPNASSLRPRRHAAGDPARRVDRHAAARWPLQTHDPSPRDQRGDNGSVLFAEKPSREGGGGPADAVARQRGVHGEHRERRGHQLGPAYEVRDGFDVHRMHGEDEPSGERAAIARPAAGDERHRDARPGVPPHVRRVKPRRPAHAPVERVCREGQRTVHPAAQLRRPVWLEKRAPHTAPAEHQRVEVHDGIVVEREAVPQGDRKSVV